MIDLHSHILPGIDDGASDISVSLALARAYAAQGVSTVACTPHILPGIYHNTGTAIRAAVDQLQQLINEEGIPLQLMPGADNHIAPDFVPGLRSGHLLALGDTRFVLVEPPHHIVPVRLEDLFFAILVAGFVPVMTHPERLTWIESRYERIGILAKLGVWMQITSGSLLGRFGKRARYWAEHMLCEGIAQILATDAHNCDRRPPDLAEGRRAAAKLVGDKAAEGLVADNPASILRESIMCSD